MKSAMPYHGVPAPALRAICRTIFAPLEFDSPEAWRAAVLSLFRGAKYREERYAAIGLAERWGPRFEDLDALPMYEEMITTGAWWDIVDVIASHRLGALLRKRPAPMKRTMRAWAKSPNLWKRRAAILCQLGFKERTDTSLLYACIEPSLKSDEFFLEKAIGWALRQYAWTNPQEVRRYVRAHERELSTLSRREALKNAGAASKRR
jgi:3-methyladenine DNA glycosylase AlkD